MIVSHPLNALPEGWPTWTAFIVLIVLFLVSGRLTRQDALTTKESPWSVISMELAAYEKGKAQKIIKAWSEPEDKLGFARRHLFWDSVFFIPVYSTLLALGCVMAARVLHHEGTRAYDMALFVAWLPWLAGLLDLIENYAIWKMLDGFKGEGLPWLATAPATLKFIIIIATLAYSLVGLVARLFK